MTRSLSALQLAGLVGLLGSLVAVMIPEFLSNLHSSRLAEPLHGLRHLSSAATMQAAGAPTRFAYPETAPRTPENVPAGKSQKDPSGTWSHSSWHLLNFRKTEPHFFSFEFESSASDKGAHFVARAFGDLDGDGELSHFEIFGEVKPGSEPTIYPVRIHREIE